MFPFKEQYKLYRKPFEVLSLADFTLEPGDTLFMPAGYWHHMEYLNSGFAMSLRELHPTLQGKLKVAWNLFGMRTIDTVMKKTMQIWWYENKKRKIFENAKKELQLTA